MIRQTNFLRMTAQVCGSQLGRLRILLGQKKKGQSGLEVGSLRISIFSPATAYFPASVYDRPAPMVCNLCLRILDFIQRFSLTLSLDMGISEGGEGVCGPLERQSSWSAPGEQSICPSRHPREAQERAQRHPEGPQRQPREVLKAARRHPREALDEEIGDSLQGRAGGLSGAPGEQSICRCW